MKYLSIIRAAPNQGDPPQALMDAIGTYVEDSIRDGSLVQTGGLAASRDGVRIRQSGRKLAVIDGPFTEAKEVIGGYAIIEAATREAAIASARKFMELHTRHWPEWVGECEVRGIDFLAP